MKFFNKENMLIKILLIVLAGTLIIDFILIGIWLSKK